MNKEQQREYIKCALDFEYWAETYLKVENKMLGDGVYIPLKITNNQKKVVETYQKESFVCISKYRQAAVTTLTCAYTAHKIVFSENLKIALIANKLGLAKEELLVKVVTFIEGIPEWMQPGKNDEKGKFILYDKDSDYYKIFKGNGCHLKALAAGKQGLRGYSVNLAVIDECGFFEFGQQFWQAASGSLIGGGSCIMISTPNSLDSFYYPTVEGAKNKTNKFKYVEIQWYDDERYNVGLRWVKGYNTIDTRTPKTLQELKDLKNQGIDVIETTDPKIYKDLIKKGYNPESDWFIETCKGFNWDRKKIAQELQLSFLGSGNNFIDEKYLQEQEKINVQEPIRYEYIDRNFWVWEDPIPDQKYIISIDVSSGRGEDNSAINILKILENGVEQVAEYNGKIPPEILGEIGYHYAIKYNDAYCIVDVTGSYGVPTMQKILEYGYKNVHYSKIRQSEIKSQFDQFIKNEDDVPGFIIGTNRGLMLMELERVFRSNEIIVRSTRLISELKNFLSVDSPNRVADHRRSTHDDIIMSVALALHVLSSSMKIVQESSDRSKKLLDAWINPKNLPANQEKYQDIIKQQRGKTGNPYQDNSWLFK